MIRVVISKSEFSALEIPTLINPCDFIESSVKISAKSNVLENIDLSLTPYTREPISCFANRDIETIIIIAPTQSGKTLTAQAKIAYMIDQDPGPVQVIYPTEDDAKKSIKEKIITMIDKSPALKKHLISDEDANKSGIALDNMTIYPGWAGGAGSISSYAQKAVIWDEVRLMDLQIGAESNAIKLGEDRLTTFLEYGLGQGVMVSSASTEGDLLHQQLTIPGTIIFYWHVPCETCGKYQRLMFRDNIPNPLKTKEWHDKHEIIMQIPDDEKAHCVCRYCGAEFSGLNMKREWNNKGVYAEIGAEISDKGEVKNKHFGRRVCFRWNSMVSPFRSFERIQREYHRTEKNKNDYKNFVQAWEAEFWKQIVRERKWEEVYKSLKVESPEGVIPEWTEFLTAGVDVQKDYFYFVIRAWGEGGRSRLVQNRQITNINDFEKFIILQRFHGVKKEFRVILCCVDSGFEPFRAYMLCKHFNAKYGECCRPTKGGSFSAPYYGKNIEYSGADSKPIPGGIILWHSSADYWKNYVTGKWDIPAGQSSAWELHNQCSEDYMRQITSEGVREVKDKKGRTRYEWIVIDSVSKNHYFDAECQAALAADMCGTNQVFAQGPQTTEPKQAQQTQQAEGNDWVPESFW